jgi:hypothetical protein
MQALLAAMFAESKPKSARSLDAEQSSAICSQAVKRRRSRSAHWWPTWSARPFVSRR